MQRHHRLILPLLLLLLNARRSPAEPTPSALTAFNTYTLTVEQRLADQHRSPTHFIATTPNTQLFLEHLTTPSIPGALLHHWRGTAFVPGATAADFQHLLRDFSTYPQHFAPQVTSARVLASSGDRLQATMRVRQHHVLTVVMDTAYDIHFGQLDRTHGYSISRSTRIDEIASPNTPAEHILSASDDHGFLWRLNTYWSWQECNDGLLLQIEAVSLTRGIPHGLAWAAAPYVESIPRDSLAFTLDSARKALMHH